MGNLEGMLGDPLLNAIDAAIVKENNRQETRNYVGASGIGGDCSRKLWYGLHGYKQKFTADTLRKINDGYTTEETVIRWLRMVPNIKLYTHDENNKQYGFSDIDGKYRGHYDGVIKGIPQSPNTWHIFEVKCVDEKYFKEVEKIKKEVGEKNTLKIWRPEYYAQAVTYMWYEKLTRHLTIIASAGGRKLLTVRTEQDHTYAKSLKEKAKRIIDSPDPPTQIGDRNYYKCKMCGFYDICHG